ncbi:TIGR00282 family metallophosphoesterase [Candidatus Auribacterota bacterium]
MNILVVGDIVGKPGRRAVEELYPKLKKAHAIDLFIANCENAAHGSGITSKIADEIFAMGVDVITMGDHMWDQKDIYDYVQKSDRILRPANYPKGVPGKGSVIAEAANGSKVAVINLVGRIFMNPAESPFTALNDLLDSLKRDTPVIIVDMHAEATSEKIALGWYADGRASAVLGTHTHVQTSDERVLPNGTAYISDLGMTGPHRSVLGREIEPVLKRFTTLMPSKLGVATEDVKLSGVVIDIDEMSGRAKGIKRICVDLPE